MNSRMLVLFCVFASLLSNMLFAAPVVTVIDGFASSSVEVGQNHSLQSRNDLTGINLPVISYSVIDRSGDNILYDAIKLAFCTSDCDTIPQYTNYVVANTQSLGGRNKLAISKGKPVIAYYEGINYGNLKIASCMSNCYTTHPDYITANAAVDIGYSEFDIGLINGNPLLAYGSDSINIAYCIENCKTTNPTFYRRSTGIKGSNISKITLKIFNGKPVISYQTMIDWGYTRIYTVQVISCAVDCFSSSGVYRNIFSVFGSAPDLALDGTKRPVVSYTSAEGLKIAYCQSGCYSTNPVYKATLITPKPATSSLAVKTGNQVFLSYYDGLYFKLAYCKTGCDAALPLYQRRTISAMAKGSKLKLFNDNPAMTFYDNYNDLSIVACDKATCSL